MTKSTETKKTYSAAEAKALREAASDMWVCPITGKSIPKSNVAAIERHKKDLIASMEAAEEKKKLAAAKAALARKFRAGWATVKTFDDALMLIVQFLSDSTPDGPSAQELAKTLMFVPVKPSGLLSRYTDLSLFTVGGMTAAQEELLSKVLSDARSYIGTYSMSVVKRAFSMPIWDVPANASAGFKNQVRLAANMKWTIPQELKQRFFADCKDYEKMTKEKMQIAKSLHDLRARYNAIEQSLAASRMLFIQDNFSEIVSLQAKKKKRK